MKRTVEQNRTLHGLIKKMADAAGVELAEAKNWAQRINWELNRKRHTHECTVEECEKLINVLREKVKSSEFKEHPASPKASPGQAEEMITKKQLEVLQHMYEDLGWFELKQQIGFNKRIIKKPWPQTRGEGVKIYQALETMLLTKMPAKRVREFAEELNRIKGKLNHWERGFAVDLMRKIQQGKKISGRVIKKAIEIQVKYNAPSTFAEATADCKEQKV